MWLWSLCHGNEEKHSDGDVLETQKSLCRFACSPLVPENSEIMVLKRLPLGQRCWLQFFLPLICLLVQAASVHWRLGINHMAYFGSSWDVQHYPVCPCLLAFLMLLSLPHCPFSPKWYQVKKYYHKQSFVNSSLGKKTKIFIFNSKICNSYLPSLKCGVSMTIVLTESL